MPAEITDAERIRWQMQAASLLAKLLDRAAKDGLPAIAWTVTPAGSGLNGTCQELPYAIRGEHFEAWLAAISALAGQEPEHDRETTTPAGETRRVVQWNAIPLRPGTRYPAVRVTLTASIWPDDDEEEG